uniref:ubiquitinyl hydrolase 1 n=1 Tax=Macrostomum lignano TaxID=282301 RepID=A0A1I8IIT2_9PLAT
RPGRKHWTRNERNDAKKQPIITVSNAHSAIGKRKVSTMANGTTSVVPVKRMATHGSSAMVSCIRIVQLDKSAASPPARPMVTGVQPGGPAVQLISLVTGESVRASKVAATASIVTPAAPLTSSTRVCSSCGYVTRLDRNETITILRLQIIRDDDIDFPHLIRASLLSSSNRSDILCENCTTGQCSHNQTLASLSKILCVGIGRVSYDSKHGSRKITSPMPVELSLQLNGRSYNLRAAVVHFGRSAENGHYAAYTFYDGYKCIFISDSSVRAVSLSSAFADIKHNCCALFYG